MRFYPQGPDASTGRQIAYAAALGTREADVSYDDEGLIQLRVTGLDPVLRDAEEQLLRASIANPHTRRQTPDHLEADS